MRLDAAQDRPQIEEIPVITVWPSIGAFSLGRWVGRMCSVRAGIGGFFTLGKLLAVATIPVSFLLYFWRLAPRAARRYSLTSRRIVIRRGLAGADGRSIGLLDFDSIQVRILPGQEFLRSGDLVFRSAGQDLFLLTGVPNPETFRQACLKAQMALAGVAKVLDRQAEAAARSPAAGNSA
ncbi:MAG: PH domain-containing protein [Pirellulaceae bacterium]|jgi:hypothetical protein|nr:PH domain-containing protein [Thermoguttaceae bacterium]MDI9442553.1 PH domain-containing protein [Planctomycetota bacterium]NLZ01983.1 PH domain-containing protein [Pirellulaceae bacterium]